MSTVTLARSTTSPAAATRWGVFRVLLEEQRADCVEERELIDEIDTALDRIADGTYGRCANCGVDIAVERLESRPSAAGCAACQVSAR
jgi:DnaK suppressor protein